MVTVAVCDLAANLGRLLLRSKVDHKGTEVISTVVLFLFDTLFLTVVKSYLSF